MSAEASHPIPHINKHLILILRYGAAGVASGVAAGAAAGVKTAGVSCDTRCGSRWRCVTAGVTKGVAAESVCAAVEVEPGLHLEHMPL